MRSSTDVPEYLAIARVREVVESHSLFVCTARGSALDELQPPFEARLYLPKASLAGSFEDLEPSFFGPSSGRFLPLGITETRLRRHHYLLRAQVFEPVDAVGGWICVHRSLLEKTGHLFFFQIRQLPVRRQPGGDVLGYVDDYLETGANGVLQIKQVDGSDVLLPLHPDFVTIDLEEGQVLVPSFDDFL